MQNQDGEPFTLPEPAGVRPALPIHRRAFEIWTMIQRRSLLGLCIVILVFLGIERWRKPSLITDPPPSTPLRSDQLMDRIDPNTADASALAAIPNLGEKKAAEIVEFRSNFRRSHPDQLAFKNADDLLRLKGIGVATVASLSPYLTFHSNRPSTNPPDTDR